MTLKIAALLLMIMNVSLFADKRLDAWFEATDVFGVSGGGSAELIGAERDITLDHGDFKNGDFSLLFTCRANAAYFGFKPASFLPLWNLSPDSVLNFYAKVQRSVEIDNGMLVFFDKSGNSKAVKFTGFNKNTDWQKFEVPLKSLDGEGFDFKSTASFKFRVSLKKGDKIWFDDVCFTQPNGGVLGITDKTVNQRMREAAYSKPARVQASFENAVTDSPAASLNDRFAKLYLGIALDEVNADLLNIFTTTDLKLKAKYGMEYTWHLAATPMLYRLYLNFGSKGRLNPGRLYPETEKALLELLWERTVLKNDIHLARQSTWWMSGSENHDMNAKASSLIASKIFSELPEYASRILPNEGTGGGSGYWFHITQETGRFHGIEGRGTFKDGKEYNSRDHYEQWLKFFEEYFTQRAQRGFFLENASPTYMKYTLTFINDIYDYCGDDELKKTVRRFLDLFWCDWAQDQIDGVRGGAKTREHGYNTGVVDSTYSMSKFYFGGHSKGDVATYTQILSDYQPPRIVWQMALDRQGMGSFAYISRRIGEEQDVWPRPMGNERTLLCDTDSRFVRYSWVTPQYILGTQMDHPAAVHSHLSETSRWQGIIFNTSPDARVFPRAVEDTGDNKWRIFKQSGMYRSVQDKNVLITQQSRGWRRVSPDWFPMNDQFSLPYGIYFSKSLDVIEEKSGWIFVQEGSSYLAVRVILGEFVPDHVGTADWLTYQATEALFSVVRENAYKWSADKTIAVLIDKYSPIIFEAATTDDYPTFAAFQEKILANEIKLQKTTVPGWYVLMYKGIADGAQEIYFNAANDEMPMVGGRYIDYGYPKLFDSPYLQSYYKSGVIEASFAGEQAKFDFRN